MTLNLKNLLNPKIKMSKMGEFQELQPIQGLQISAVSADLYGDGRDDLTLFFFDEGANFGAVYTNSKVTSASINWNLKIKSKLIRALLVNTKNANTFTGKQGKESIDTLAKNLSKKYNIPWVSTDTMQCVIMPYMDKDKYSQNFPTSTQRCNTNDEKYSNLVLE